MQTGYYVGTGATKAITGIGFQPQFVLIKANTTAGQAAFKTSAMAAANMSFIGATADNTASQLSLDANGFTLGTNASVNSNNIRYIWTAFAGSDCTASGTFCVGQYTGNGASPRTITTGFQPSFVIVKRTTTVAGHFHTASQPDNETLYLSNAVRDTTGNFIRSFTADGFTVGATDNTSSAVYNYIAFKTTSGIMTQGTYGGNATDNRDITGLGFAPNMVLVKNATNATATNTNSVMLLPESYGDSAAVLTATVDNVNTIQALQSDGFQLGTHTFTNGTGDTYYWVAFAGSGNYSSSGTFQTDVGSYTGTGANLSVTGLSFAPDLVIVKDNAANYGVFRTKVMNGDTTAYLAAATANFTGGITALNSDGFSIGTSTITNTTGNTYHWQAFGNAFNPYTNSGASDFAIGAYYGNGIDNRNINRLPWQPNLVTVKRSGATAGIWRTSSLTGDLSSFFAATAEGANNVQSLTSDGFQIGTAANVNTVGNTYWWYAFKTGTNFAVGNYTGNGSDNTDITTVGFQPDLAWIKRSTAVAGVSRPSTLTGDATQYFLNTANATGRIKSFIANGFRLGTQTEVNASGGTYRYATWRKQIVPAVSVTLSTDGTISYGTVAPGGTKSTITLSDTQTAQNDGNVTENLNIKTSNATGGTPWTVGASAGSDIYVHEFSTNNGSNWTQFTATDTYQTLVNGITVSDTQDIDFRITTPTDSSDSQQKNITLTIQAVAQ